MPTEVVIAMSNRLTQIDAALEELVADRAALVRAIDVMADARWTEKTPNYVVSPDEIAGMGVEEAAVHIATQTGEVRSRSAREVMEVAGILTNPDTASSVLHAALSDSERLQRRSRGVYTLTDPSSAPEVVTELRRHLPDEWADVSRLTVAGS